MSRSFAFRHVRPSVGSSLVGIVAATALVLTAVSASAAGIHSSAGPRPVVAGSGYLALGDSVSFGYREPANLPTPDYPDASSFVGYPEVVASSLALTLANAACPGETSASLIAANVLSNGCENGPSSTPGYRTLFPLHASYKGTQLAYAIHYLEVHPNTRLISLMIGANDGFLCQETTKDACASELPAVLKQVEANVRTILVKLRQKAGYRGQIVILNYYSLDYSSAAKSGFSQALNAAQDTAAAPFNVTIADGYGAFQKAAAQVGGNSCTAGLLTTLTTGGCGVHPSVAGQALLASTVAAAVKH